MALAYSSAPLRAAQTGDLFGTLMHHLAVARQRRALAELDDQRLDDIGLTRANVKSELARTFWDAPAHWRR